MGCASSSRHIALNSKFRAECLNVHWFLTLADAREKMEDWSLSAIASNRLPGKGRDYNEVRPHSAIGYNLPIALHNPGDTPGPSP